MPSLDNMAMIITEDNTSKGEHVQEFLRQSNLIESEPGDWAFEDACKAWDFALTKSQLDVATIMEIHHILMNRLRPDIAGKLRTCDVWIGGNIKKYTDEQLLLWELGSVLNSMWLSLGCKTRIPFRMAAKSHVSFEEVHPFEDGNGRVGRILYNWHRLKLRLPIHIIHVGKEQQEYYGWFTNGV